MSLEHNGQTCLVHKQTGTAHYAQQSTLTDPLHHACSTKLGKTTKTRGRHPSANRERQPRQISFMNKLDYTSRFVRVISTLSPNQSSHNSIGHGGWYKMVVTAPTSQQIHMYDECQRSNDSIVLSQVLVHFVIDRANLFTDRRISGLPIRAKCKHFKRI